MPDAIVNIPGYSIFRRDRNWSGLDKRSKGGIAIYARSNLNIIDVYRSKLYELLYVILKLPSGHLLLTCGIYHPPKLTYQPADFLQYLTHLMDNALDQHPGLTIVAGGDVNRLDTNELIVLILKLPSGHLLLTCGIYHPPKLTYQPADFLQYLTHLMDNALDQHPGLTIVAGGDVNRLDTNELIVLTGWDALVDFPTRGDTYLDKVFTNWPDLFAKSIPYFVSIKTDHTAVILPAGTKLKPIRQNVRIRDCRKHRKEGLYLKLVSENWDSVLNLNDVEEAVNNLEAKINHHMDECMPLWSVHMSSPDPV